MAKYQSQSVLLHRRGRGTEYHQHDGGHGILADPLGTPKKNKKSKLGKQYSSITSGKIMIRGALAIIAFSLTFVPIAMKVYLNLKSKRNPGQPPLSDSQATEEKIVDIEHSQAIEVIEKEGLQATEAIGNEQTPFLRLGRRDKNEKATCKDLPSIYWINLDVSKERKNAIVKSMESSGIVDQHRIAAYDTKQTTALINSKQLMFHPLIKVYAGDGNPSFWKHGQNIYTYNEAACLMSHLKAIKQAYDDGREVALIVEDDASFSTFFCNEFDDYIAQAPDGWKVLQFATNNPHVVQQGSLLHEPFISWQRYHHSTRAYLITRAGMETLLGKVHYTSLTGGSIWSVQDFPTVVADEAIYTIIGDSYYSTGLWIDTSALDSTIQKHRVAGRWERPYSIVEGKESEQVAMKRETPPAQLFGRSLLVVMNVCISNKSQIGREIEVINQDIHAVCKFHRVCDWEINVVAINDSLTTLFEEAAFGLPPYVHVHTRVYSEAFSKFLFVGDIRSKLDNFDLMLFKDNDQRINGFPWRTFVEQTNDSVLSAPLRSTQRDHMLFMKEKEKSQDVQFHDANHWLFWYNARIWHSGLYDTFENIKPVEVPYLETYFTLMDAKFAKHFFESVFSFRLLDNFSLDSIWCKAAFDWDKKRPSCSLIPLVSTHEDSLNNMKLDAFNGKEPDSNSGKLMSLAKEWKEIVGKQHTVLEVEQHCLDKMNIVVVGLDDDQYVKGKTISDCARQFTEQYSLLPPPVEVEVSTPRLEFVHITKTGGSAIEQAAANVGITWGACHYMELEHVGCSSPDLPYEAPNYQSYALTSPWHTPPKLLKMYVDESKYPYQGADLFTIIRNPYSRVLSEYYCPWNGFQAKFQRGTVHDQDPSDPKVMNEWVKDMLMLKRLGTAMNEFNEKKEKGNAKEQAKGLNEDRFILAQKHYVNQADYVYDGEEIIVKNVVHYENLSSEFYALMKKYNIVVTLPPKDKGVYSDGNEARLSYQDLDPEAIELVNEFAKVDFEKFGYQMVEEKFDENYSLEAKVVE